MNAARARLTTPLVREDGVLRPATWDEALDRAAAGLAAARSISGDVATTGFGVFSCSKASNEVNYLAQKLARQVMRTNDIDSCNRT
jgi:formate dehydrogenase major subunit